MKYLALSIFLILSIFARLDRFFLKQNGSFSEKFILPDWSRCPQFPTDIPSTLDSILNQPFTYLTKGEESFVFASQDRKWVVKFSRLPRFAMRYSHKGHKNSLIRLRRVLENWHLVHNHLKSETKVVYCHLSQTKNLPPLILKDKMGRDHLLDLNDTFFFIQPYGKSFFEAFEHAENQKDLIVKTIALFESLFQKGFIDKDPILDKNFGVLHGEPFILDIGQITPTSDLPNKEIYLQQMTQSLEVKLAKDHPDLLPFYKNLLH